MTNIENWPELYDFIVFKFLEIYAIAESKDWSLDNICLYGNHIILKAMGLKSGDIFPVVINNFIYEMKVKEDNYILEHQNEDGNLTSNLFITSPDWIDYD